MPEQNGLHNYIWNDWESVRLLGTGSFGSVYEIRRDCFGYVERAALKVIGIPQSQGEVEELFNCGYDLNGVGQYFKGLLESIVREYSLMAEIKGHTNIVYCDELHTAPHDDGIGWDVYIKMELLTPMMNVLGRFSDEREVVRLGADICRALVVCREKNIIHRDIKPQNIFVSDGGDYKLGDFGVAKIAEKTTSGTKAGTYSYMAPEVYNNEAYGTSADICSLGLVMYWLLNERRLPFQPLPPAMPTAEDTDRARQLRFGGRPLPAPKNGSERLKSIVLRACAFDPKQRYHTPEELLADLQSQEPAPVPSPKPKREWVPVAAVLFLAAAVGISRLLPPKAASEAVSGQDISPEPIVSAEPVTTTAQAPEESEAKADPPSREDLEALDDDLRYLTFPQESSWLPQKETMYVRCSGHSIYVFWDPAKYMEYKRSRFAYEGDEVTVLARENGASCIICTNREGQTFAGWVDSDFLVY